MTNEEHALSLSRKYATPKNKNREIAVYQSCVDMAEWKDKQYADIIKEESNTSYESGLAEGERKAEARFKEYLEKKKEKYGHERGTMRFGGDVIDVIINELFKED